MSERLVALLRAVNVAGHGKVPMADLRECAQSIGLARPATILASGNLLFDRAALDPAGHERQLEGALEHQFGLRTDVFVRDAVDWREIVDGNPFRRQAEHDPAHLVLLCLKAAPDPARVAALQSAVTGHERIEAAGRHAYVVYPDGIGDSRLTTAVIEAKLGTRATGRNWNTVCKIAAAL